TTLVTNVPAPPEIYTLSLHDALPIYPHERPRTNHGEFAVGAGRVGGGLQQHDGAVSHQLSATKKGCFLEKSIGRALRTSASSSRSEEHTSELQSRVDLVCRLLLAKKK